MEAGHGRNHARQRNLPPPNPAEFRSCPKAVKQLPERCSGIRDSAQPRRNLWAIWPYVGHVWQTLAEQMPTSTQIGHTGPDSDQHWPRAINVSRDVAEHTQSVTKNGRTWPKLGQRWPKMALGAWRIFGSSCGQPAGNFCTTSKLAGFAGQRSMARGEQLRCNFPTSAFSLPQPASAKPPAPHKSFEVSYLSGAQGSDSDEQRRHRRQCAW